MSQTSEVIDYAKRMEDELAIEKAKALTMQKEYGQISMFNQQQEQSNIIQWQLDLQEELNKIEHLLKGEIIKVDQHGSEYWAEQPNPDLRPLNAYGVALIMNVISFYLNRNTILSNYTEESINSKMDNFAEELADLIFLKYEMMGMDTKEKKKMYPILCRCIVDTVHSAYLRALGGNENRSLRQITHVSQNLNPTGQMYNQQNQSSRQFSLMSPSTWRNII